MGARSKAWTVFAHFNSKFVGSNHSRHWCLCLFCVCIRYRLCDGLILVLEVLLTVLDVETKVKRSVPQMLYAASGSNRNRGRRGRALSLWFLNVPALLDILGWNNKASCSELMNNSSSCNWTLGDHLAARRSTSWWESEWAVQSVSLGADRSFDQTISR
jgi:hypothetical protein